MGGCPTHRSLLVVIAVLCGLVAAQTTGILVVATGSGVVVAVLSGGGAFVAVVPLVLQLEKELGLFQTGDLDQPSSG